MREKTDNSIKVYGANVLSVHLKAFATEIDGVRTATDIEAVHRMRVASRRLRCTLPLFKNVLPQHKAQHWLDSITRVADDLGTLRDNEVQIGSLRQQLKVLPDEHYKPGVNRLLLRLTQSHKKLHTKTLHALEKLEVDEVLPELFHSLERWQELSGETYWYTPAVYTLSFEAIVNRLDQFLALEEAIFRPEQIKEIHEMRMCARWLRYTCETFAPLYSDGLKIPLQALRELQGNLGNLHDCDVWIHYLPNFMRDEEKRTLDYFGNVRNYRALAPGLNYILEQKQHQRLMLYQAFILSWQQWQAENVWDDLHQSIQIPFQQPTQQSTPPEPAA